VGYKGLSMPSWGRFLLVLVPGLALVAWIALVAVSQLGRQWIEADMSARARLAVASARGGLLGAWMADDEVAITGTLRAMARDERVMAATACTADGRTVAATPEYPAEAGCAHLVTHLGAPGAQRSWSDTLAARGGDVHVTAVWLREGNSPVGFVALVHDLGVVERFHTGTRQVVLGGFLLLLAGGWLMMVLAGRLSRRRWFDDLRRMLRTGEQKPEFRPLMQDVRELVEQLAAETQSGTRPAPWTASRLGEVLRTRLGGESVIVVANREPYVHERVPGNGITVVHPASGLVTALEPVMRACSGTWIAHGGGSADRATADQDGRLRVPPEEPAYWLRRIWLSEAEEQGYYYGFANEGLWPLCHLAHQRPTFRQDDWRHYEAVNRRFADAVADEATESDQVVLVQDYHFALVPRFIRERLPRATILAFWHVPWPNAERIAICPWRRDLLRGLLGCGIVGFHTQQHCNNFLDAVDRFLEARIDRERNAVVRDGWTTLVRAYPISIEWPSRWAIATPPPGTCRSEILAELGLPRNALIGVGVDRLDYTKGIEERLLAVERMLERYPEHIGRFVFVQLAAPSRSAIPAYRDLVQRVEDTVAHVNARFGGGSYRPVVLRRSHHEPAEVFRYYKAADVCYVSSLHDGMNLVAKEFVAARDDEQGVLVLSTFTGASRELSEALVVNPYDLDEAAAALAAALAMAPHEQRARMHAMRGLLAHFNVYRWAGRMLSDAARLREQERLSARLTAWRAPAATP